MSITITADTVEEAVEVLTALTGQQQTHRLVPGAGLPWSGINTPDAPEEPLEDIEDIDLTATAEDLAEETPRCKPWTKREALQVQRWVNSGVTPKEAGERVGRSASSVKNKLRWMEQRQRELLHLKTPEADQ
jgi:hypothetical protein